MPRSLMLGLGMLLLAAGTAAAAQRNADLQMGLTGGYDSNPLELSEGDEAGLFSQLALEGALDVEWNHRVSLYGEMAGVARVYEHEVAGAEYGWADVRAGVAVVAVRRGQMRFTVAAGGSLGVSRATFIDPATGEVVLMGPDPNTIVPIPDRYDYDSRGVFLDLRWRLNAKLLLFLDSQLQRRAFTESYAEVPTLLQSLDDVTRTLEPGLRWQVGDRVSIDASAQWSERDYDELAALDQDGLEVAGTRREYRYTRYRVGVTVDPLSPWDVSVGAEGSGRDDTFAGYYDHLGAGAFVSAGYALGEKTRFRLHASQRGVRYDNALVDSDPDGPRRAGDLTRIVGRAERDLIRQLTLTIEAGTSRSDNKDPLYVYDRSWIQTGIRWKL